MRYNLININKTEPTESTGTKPETSTRPHRKKRRRPKKKKTPPVDQAARLRASHKEWDPNSFKVTPTEGKSRFHDFEIRFTADSSWAQYGFSSYNFIKIPFELWDIGQNTPDNPADDEQIKAAR